MKEALDGAAQEGDKVQPADLRLRRTVQLAATRPHPHRRRRNRVHRGKRASDRKHYNYFRDYEPATGRYVESDPIGLEGGVSTFGYVFGAPLLMSDVHGLAAQICCRLLANPFFGRLLRLRHCYIANGDDVFSLAPESPRFLTGKLWTDYEDDVSDARNPSASTKCKECKPKKCPDNVANCLQSSFEDYPNPSQYGFVGSNSNTMAGNVFRNCCEGSLGSGDGLGNTPGIRQGPAKPK